MYKMKMIPVLLSAALIFACAGINHVAAQTEKRLQAHINYLASDDLSGRYPGTMYDKQAGNYIEDFFKKLHIKPEYQPFLFLQSLRPGVNNTLVINGISIDRDQFSPFEFSKDTSIQAEVAFAGYGLMVKTDSFEWNDYKNLDVHGKLVMVFEGTPDIPEADKYLYLAAENRDKAMLASDQGAAGLLIITNETFANAGNYKVMTGRQMPTPIPVFGISNAVADSILKTAGFCIAEVKETIITKRDGFSFAGNTLVKMQSEITRVMDTTGNHFAIMEGTDPVLKQEYLVIGAHADHLGLGGKGSSSRMQDTVAVHNGADDNASGLAAMLEVASQLCARRDSLRRSIIFVAFGGEEMGLLGSKYFVNHPPVELKRISAMINIDMVGRMNDEKGLQIGGAGTSLEGDSLLRLINAGNLKLKVSADGNGPSDHASFYARNIPVFFFTTGAHTDYHTPFDDPEKINIQGLQQVSHYIERLSVFVCNYDKLLTFHESGSREEANPRQRFRVTLGFMPDFSATDIEGVRVDLVSKGKAAEKGGIRNGDIIKSINGMPVKNIYDYMYRLSHLYKGQIISVEILRYDKREVLLIQL